MPNKERYLVQKYLLRLLKVKCEIYGSFFGGIFCIDYYSFGINQCAAFVRIKKYIDVRLIWKKSIFLIPIQLKTDR